MQKQTKRAERGIEPLVCTYRDCKELQGEENEFCEGHSELISELCDLQQKLIAFQIVVARLNDDDWQNEEVEEIQNTINIINEYAK